MTKYSTRKRVVGARWRTLCFGFWSLKQTFMKERYFFRVCLFSHWLNHLAGRMKESPRMLSSVCCPHSLKNFKPRVTFKPLGFYQFCSPSSAPGKNDTTLASFRAPHEEVWWNRGYIVLGGQPVSLIVLVTSVGTLSELLDKRTCSIPPIQWIVNSTYKGRGGVGTVSEELALVLDCTKGGVKRVIRDSGETTERGNWDHVEPRRKRCNDEDQLGGWV